MAAAQKLLERLTQPDAVYDENVTGLLSEFVRAGGAPQDAIDALARGYKGYPEISQMLVDCLTELGFPEGHINAVIGGELQNMLLESFRPEMVDDLEIPGTGLARGGQAEPQEEEEDAGMQDDDDSQLPDWLMALTTNARHAWWSHGALPRLSAQFPESAFLRKVVAATPLPQHSGGGDEWAMGGSGSPASAAANPSSGSSGPSGGGKPEALFLPKPGVRLSDAQLLEFIDLASRNLRCLLTAAGSPREQQAAFESLQRLAAEAEFEYFWIQTQLAQLRQELRRRKPELERGATEQALLSRSALMSQLLSQHTVSAHGPRAVQEIDWMIHGASTWPDLHSTVFTLLLRGKCAPVDILKLHRLYTLPPPPRDATGFSAEHRPPVEFLRGHGLLPNLIDYLFEQNDRHDQPNFHSVQQCLYLLTLASTPVGEKEGEVVAAEEFEYVEDEDVDPAAATLGPSFLRLFQQCPAARHSHNRLKFLHDLLCSNRAFYGNPAQATDRILRHRIPEQLVCASALLTWIRGHMLSKEWHGGIHAPTCTPQFLRLFLHISVVQPILAPLVLRTLLEALSLDITDPSGMELLQLRRQFLQASLHLLHGGDLIREVMEGWNRLLQLEVPARGPSPQQSLRLNWKAVMPIPVPSKAIHKQLLRELFIRLLHSAGEARSREWAELLMDFVRSPSVLRLCQPKIFPAMLRLFKQLQQEGGGGPEGVADREWLTDCLRRAEEVPAVPPPGEEDGIDDDSTPFVAVPDNIKHRIQAFENPGGLTIDLLNVLVYEDDVRELEGLATRLLVENSLYQLANAGRLALESSQVQFLLSLLQS